MNRIIRSTLMLVFAWSVCSVSASTDLPVGALGGWQSTSELITARSHHGVAYYNRYAYAVGGNGETPSIYNDNGQPLSSVEFAKVNTDGTLSTWRSTAALPVPIMDAGVVAHKGYLYVAGGAVSLSGNQTNTVYYAAINPDDGSLGAWKTTSPMVTARKWFNLAVANGYLYAVGGGYGLTNKVEFVATNPDGTLATWKSTQNLPQPLWGVGLTAVNNRLYALGGYTSSGAGNAVYYSDLNEDGSLNGWQTAPSLPTDAWGMAVAATELEIYVIGGAENGGNDASPVAAKNSSIVYVGEVEPNGSIKQWTATNGLLAPSQALGGFSSNNKYVYAIGGTTSGSSQDPVKTAQFATIEGSQNHIPMSPTFNAPTISYSVGEPWSVAFKMTFNPNYSNVSEYGFTMTPQGGSGTVTVFKRASEYTDKEPHTVISTTQDVSPANTRPENSSSNYTAATIYDLKGYVKVGTKTYTSDAVTFGNITPIAVKYVSHTTSSLTFDFLYNASRLSSGFNSQNTYLLCDSPIGKKTFSSFSGSTQELLYGAYYTKAQNTVTIPNIANSGTINCDIVYRAGGTIGDIVTDNKTDMDIVIP